MREFKKEIKERVFLEKPERIFNEQPHTDEGEKSHYERSERERRIFDGSDTAANDLFYHRGLLLILFYNLAFIVLIPES